MEVIYADELFVLNALIDYLLVCLGARLAALPLRRGRFVLAAALGGAYALAAAALPWLRAGSVKLAASLLLSLIAYGGGRSLWRGWGAFLAVSALFAGAAFAGVLLSGQSASPSGGIVARLSLRMLALTFGVCWAAVRFALGRIEQRQRRKLADVTLRLDGREARLRALRDTGNALTDPLRGDGVLIADSEALAPLLPFPLPREILGDAAALFRTLSAEPALRGRLRLVPYAALGSAGALLVCFRPDAVLVDGAEVALLAAISPTPLGSGEFNAIL